MKHLARIFSLFALAFCTLSAPAATDTASSKEVPQLNAPCLMIGDSMMRLLGASMEREFKKAKIEPSESFSSLGSGLIRPSVFDWTAKTDELLKTHKPKTVFVAIGTNDRQAIEAAGGGFINYGGADWEAAYRLRVAALMDQLLAGDVEYIVWFLLPDMKAPANQEHAQLVNKIVTELASEELRKDKVRVLDMGPLLSRKPGKFSAYMMSPSGEAIAIRDRDGVHLTRDGAKVVAKAVLKLYWKK